MEFQSAFHGLAKTGDRDITRGVFLRRPRAETTVDRPIRVKEKGGKGEVVVKLKQVKVQRVALDQSHTNKLIHHILQLRLETDNLPVKLRASLSRDAAEGGQNRFARALAFCQRTIEFVIDPLTGRFDMVLVIPDLGIAILRCLAKQRARCEHDQRGGNNQTSRNLHGRGN